MRKIMVGIIGLTLIFINVSYFPQAKAATVTVTNLNDSGAGSLRQAIADAIPNDIIKFSVTGTIVLTSGEISISTDLTIDGSSLSTPITISGNGTSRIFNISGTYAVILDTLILKDGYIYGNPAQGGAIKNSGSLTLKRVALTNNHADGGQSEGGAIYNNGTLIVEGSTFIGNQATSAYSYGGAIFNEGTLSVDNSTFSGNRAYSDYTSEGGAIYNDGSMDVTNSTFSGNTAKDSGGGIYNDIGANATLANCTIKDSHAISGGGIFNAGTLTMTDCTIGENNTVDDHGGGIDNHGTATLTNCTITGNSGTGVTGGAGIDNSSTMTLTNCTISGNETNVDGGGIRSSKTLTLINCTITNNTADANGDGSGAGGGIFGFETIEVRNTIIAGNADLSPTGSAPDLIGTFTSQGFNLIGKSDGSSGFIDGVNNDIVGTIASPVDPRLGPLSYNGGPTKTHALLGGSPAKDAIPEGGNGYNGAPSTDQRGVRRPQPPGGNCDIGAFEVFPSQGILIERNPQSSLLPLASTNISRGNDLLNRANDLVSQARSKGLDAALCERLIEEAHELLDKAKASRANPIYANNLALKAIEKLKQAADCLKALLG